MSTFWNGYLGFVAVVEVAQHLLEVAHQHFVLGRRGVQEAHQSLPVGVVSLSHPLLEELLVDERATQGQQLRTDVGQFVGAVVSVG